jgi:hypothetical protein
MWVTPRDGLPALGGRNVNVWIEGKMGLGDLSPGALFLMCSYGGMPLRTGWHHLKACDGPAGIALELLNTIRARHRHGVMATARRTFQKLECAVWLQSSASSGTPIGVATP